MSRIERSLEALPAEMRVGPVVEPTVEVDADAHVPPEAAVTAVTHHHGTSRDQARADRHDDEAYRAVAAAEAAAEEAHLPPAEMRVPPTLEPAVEVDEGAHLPPEAAVTPRTRRP